MKLSSILCFLAVIFAWNASPLAAANVETEIYFESTEPKAGSTIQVAVIFKPKDGWHTYWKNPGDAGAPPRIRWKSNFPVRFSSPLFPRPYLLDSQGIASFVHKGDHALIFDATIPNDIAQGSPINIAAEVEWLSCSTTQCVPERTSIRSVLVAGNGSSDFVGLSRLKRANDDLPLQKRGVIFDSNKDEIRIRFDGRYPDAFVFPDEEGTFEASAKQTVVISGNQTTVTIPLSGKAIASFSGVVSTKTSAFEFSATKASLFSEDSLPGSNVSDSSVDSSAQTAIDESDSSEALPKSLENEVSSQATNEEITVAQVSKSLDESVMPERFVLIAIFSIIILTSAIIAFRRRK